MYMYMYNGEMNSVMIVIPMNSLVFIRSTILGISFKKYKSNTWCISVTLVSVSIGCYFVWAAL